MQKSDELSSDYLDRTEDEGWVQWFCGLDGNEFLVEVDEEFIRDRSNMFGLARNFPTRFECVEP